MAVLASTGTTPRVLTSLVSSQIDLHRLYGGVVPEVASRNHALKMRPLVEAALEEAGVTADTVDAFAATRGPGLSSSLLIGHSMAKSLALSQSKPFLSVNHMEGHLLSPFLDAGGAAVPSHLALVVSGGHTLLVDVEGLGAYRIVGRTLDDAAGEAFDKVARLLGLPYPGGPEIEARARDGNPAAYHFPRSIPDELDFSFSGLKTAVRYTLPQVPDLSAELANLCASFQQAVIDVLVDKSVRAAIANKRDLVTLSGGVSCNQALRSAMQEACASAGLRFLSCRPDHSTDNAAMIAFAAWHHLQQGRVSDLHEDIDPNLPLV